MRTIILALALAAASPAAAVTDNAYASFNGTQGAGNFFYGQLTGRVYTALTACGGDTAFPFSACLGSASYPYFGVASMPGTTVFGATQPGDRLMTHADAVRLGVIIWRAPVAGDYRIDAIFSLLHDERRLSNGVGITAFYQPLGEAAQLVPRFVFGVTETGVSLVRGFGTGDLYGFIIDPNGSTAYDVSGVNVTATSLAGGSVPEPASWALMIAGFGLVSGAMRRRRPAAVAA